MESRTGAKKTAFGKSTSATTTLQCVLIATTLARVLSHRRIALAANLQTLCFLVPLLTPLLIPLARILAE
jgi:ABC-type spermidine/putrescine transport system permease subunit I